MKGVAAKFVPKLLNFEKKPRRIEVAQESLNEVNEEIGVYGCDVETKAKSSLACCTQYKFFDFTNIVCNEFLPQSQTVNK